MNPWVKIGILLAVFGAGFASAWSWHGALNEAEKQTAISNALAEREKTYTEEQAKANASGKAAEKKLAALEIVNREQARRLDYAISKNAAFGSCAYGPDGVRAINDTVDGFEGGSASEHPAESGKAGISETR